MKYEVKKEFHPTPHSPHPTPVRTSVSPVEPLTLTAEAHTPLPILTFSVIMVACIGAVAQMDRASAS